MSLVTTVSKILLREGFVERLLLRLFICKSVLVWTPQLWLYAHRAQGEPHEWHYGLMDILFLPMYFLPRLVECANSVISYWIRTQRRLKRAWRRENARFRSRSRSTSPWSNMLDAMDREICLIYLQPSSAGDMRITTSVVSLYDDPVYTALSYVCGDPKIRHEVIIDGFQSNVSTNLYQALLHLRDSSSETETRAFWIDALSINQQNLQERSQQVQLMKSIYEQAAKVLVWLGPPSEDSELALAKMKALEAFFYASLEPGYDGSLKVFDDTSSNYYTTFPAEDSNDFHDEPWEAIWRILANPWWSRAWIAQEVSSPVSSKTPTGNVEIILGRQSQTISFRSTLRLIAFLTGLMHTSRRWMNSDYSGSLVDRLNAAASGISRLMAVGNLRKAESFTALILDFYLYPTRSLRERRRFTTEVWHMLRLFRGLEATDARDKIFASFPLVLPAGHPAFRPNYNDSLEEVFVAVTENFIRYQGNLNILSACNTRSSILPSFIPDWRLSSIRREFCVWTDIHEQPIYQAGGTSTLKTRMTLETARQTVKAGEQRSALLVHGLAVDTIKVLSPTHPEPRSVRRQSWEAAVLSSTLPLYYTPTKEPLACAYQRTLTADVHSYSQFSLDAPNATRMQRFRSFLETIELHVTAWVTQAHKSAPSYSVFSRLSDGAATSYMAHKRGAVFDWDVDLLKPWDSEGGEPDIPFSLYRHLVSVDGEKTSPWLTEGQRLASAEQDYRELIAEATWGRVLCVTEKGYIGLAPDNTEVGDEVVVFFGGGTPFIIRQVEDRDQDDKANQTNSKTLDEMGRQNTESAVSSNVHHQNEEATNKPSTSAGDHQNESRRWKLVGEAYIHGIMDGELMTNRKTCKDGMLEGSQTFILI